MAVFNDEDVEDDLEALTSDFSRLRESIAAELRRTAGAGASASLGVTTAKVQFAGNPAPAPAIRPDLPAMRPPMPPPPPPAGTVTDEEIPAFHALREDLLGRVPSNLGMAPHAPLSAAGATACLSNPPPVPLSRGGVGASTSDPPSLSDEFQALRASITAKLRATSAEAISAAGPASEATTVFRMAPSSGAPAAAKSYAPPESNTVLLSARKPGASGGPRVLAAMDSHAAALHGSSHGPPQRPRVNVTTPGAAATIAATAEMSDVLPRPTTTHKGVASSGGGGGGEGEDSSDIMFGYLAMRSALESHRMHYEAARAKLPPVAQYRPTPGMMPPPAAPKSSSSGGEWSRRSGEGRGERGVSSRGRELGVGGREREVGRRKSSLPPAPKSRALSVCEGAQRPVCLPTTIHAAIPTPSSLLPLYHPCCHPHSLLPTTPYSLLLRPPYYSLLPTPPPPYYFLLPTTSSFLPLPTRYYFLLPTPSSLLLPPALLPASPPPLQAHPIWRPLRARAYPRTACVTLDPPRLSNASSRPR